MKKIAISKIGILLCALGILLCSGLQAQKFRSLWQRMALRNAASHVALK